MMESDLFPTVAADVAMQAIEEGIALKKRSWQEVYDLAKKDIDETHAIVEYFEQAGFIKEFPEEMIRKVMSDVCEEIRHQ